MVIGVWRSKFPITLLMSLFNNSTTAKMLLKIWNKKTALLPIYSTCFDILFDRCWLIDGILFISVSHGFCAKQKKIVILSWCILNTYHLYGVTPKNMLFIVLKYIFVLASYSIFMNFRVVFLQTTTTVYFLFVF